MNYSAFFQEDRIGSDDIDKVQRELLNGRTASYQLSNFHPSASQSISFATQYPTLSFSGMTTGAGTAIGSETVEVSSQLQRSETKELDKLCLQSRTFLTIPYLGRGSCDPTVESQLFQGENSKDKKSVATIMTTSFMDYQLPPKDTEKPLGPIEEAALDGFVWGGLRTRQMIDKEHFASESRPRDFL
jgi:hypothetical protein